MIFNIVSTFYITGGFATRDTILPGLFPQLASLWFPEHRGHRRRLCLRPGAGRSSLFQASMCIAHTHSCESWLSLRRDGQGTVSSPAMTRAKTKDSHVQYPGYPALKPAPDARAS